MFGQLFENCRRSFAGLKSEKHIDEATGEVVYVLRRVAFRGPQDAEPFRDVMVQQFTDWNQYRREFEQAYFMLEMAP
jgi:hypothetical protein